jgi:hypothetical protein
MTVAAGEPVRRALFYDTAAARRLTEYAERDRLVGRRLLWC